MPGLFRLFLLSPLLLCIGCASFETPQPSPTIGPDANTYELSDYERDYHDYRVAMGEKVLVQVAAPVVQPSSVSSKGTPRPAVPPAPAPPLQYVQSPPNYVAARVIRDRMIYRILTDIDTNYGQYKGHLHTGRAGIITGGDVASLGLSAAGAVTGTASLKAILATADTGLKGVTHSYDKNFFAEQTTEILITRMDALHKNKKTEIRSKVVALDVTAYSFDEAKDDLTEYFYSGTREAALVALAAEAGQKEVEATKKSEDATMSRVDKAQFATPTTPENINMVVAIRDRLEVLYKGEESVLVQEAKRILTAYSGTTPGAVTSAASAKRELENAFNVASDDTEKLKSLYKAVFPQN